MKEGFVFIVEVELSIFWFDGCEFIFVIGIELFIVVELVMGSVCF